MTSSKHILLPFSVFITGASILIVEVVGVRILSPFYGNTIFTVSSVISVILFALSLGYYLGGRLADRYPSLRYFFALILIGGLVLLTFYSLGTVALPALSSKLSIVAGPLVSATLLFLVPALLLGALCPYAVKLQSVHFPEKGVGSIAGNIFFWSTLGSIAGSLSAGFLLIPYFGIDRILIANGAILCVLGFIPLLFLNTQKHRLYLAAILLALALSGAYFAYQRTNRNVLYQRDGFYQKITIYDGHYEGRPTRFLQQDENSAGAGEGAMFLDSDDPTDLAYDYTRYYSLYKLFSTHVKNALVIGGGAYSVPKALLHDLPAADIDVVEIEPSLSTLAKSYFRLPESPRLHNYTEDGRHFLYDSGRKYDLIFVDVYYSFFSVPSHFATEQFFEIARQKLNPDGILVANMIGDLSRQQPSLIMAEIKTFRKVFSNSYFFAVAWPERTDSQNVMLVAYNSPDRVDLNSPAVSNNRDPLIRSLPEKLIDVDRRFDLSPYPILTDNFSPVEFLTAKVLRRAFAPDKIVDGEEMLADVAQQKRYGPRYPGTSGYEKEREFLLAEMKLLAQDVKTEVWTSSEGGGKPDEMRNIIGRFYSPQRRVVLATHYSGGPAAGKGPAGSTSVVNDGSGVALLVELARSFADLNVPPDVGIDLVFLDGADSAKSGSNSAGLNKSGSRYFGEHLRDLYGESKPALAIILDNVCGENLHLLKEESSTQNALSQIQTLWDIGERAAPSVFQNRAGPRIEDDQAAFIQAGVPTVLLVDSQYGLFAPGQDTYERCSARTFEGIGQTLMQYVTRPEGASTY